MKTRASIPPDYFERLYGRAADPWSFETSPYEKAKYEATLDAIGTRGGDLLEIGCSIGVLTHRLAARCRHILAVDVVESALAAARKRCWRETNVEFEKLALPRELPSGLFDTVLLSEVGYYWDLADLNRFAGWLLTSLTVRGRCVLVHWTGDTDYPLSGDEVHDHLRQQLAPALTVQRSLRRPEYRLDVLARQRSSRRQSKGPDPVARGAAVVRRD
jgi:cyclopropane fatty-acyl-phospholipid synthase-like methyltransferase